MAFFAGEEGLGGPGGAPENTGGIGGGSHRVEFFVPFCNEDVLCLITGEKKVEVVEPEVENLSLTIRFLEDESKPSTDGSLPDAKYRWRIDSEELLQVVERGIKLGADGAMTGNWGSGPGGSPKEGPVDLIVRPRVDGSTLLLDTETRTAGGSGCGRAGPC